MGLRGLLALVFAVVGLWLLPAASFGAVPPGGLRRAPKAVPCRAAALVRAIKRANAGGGGHLRLSSKCTYTLTVARAGTEDGLPPIRSAITIDGRRATIKRSTDARTPAFRIFEVLGGGHLVLHSLTISRGDAPGPEPDGGGGIEVRKRGSLFARSVVVRGNVGALGGGVNNFGTTDMANSVVAGNEALHGGGVSNSTRSGRLRLINTLILRNRAESDAGVAGGVYNQEGASARLVNVSIRNNVADNSGGGIRNDYGSVMKISNSWVSHNRAGPLVNAPTTLTAGGIQNLGTMVLRNTTVRRNHATKIGSPTKAYGGGIANVLSDAEGAAAPRLSVINSRITHNVADNGAGGIYNDHGSVTLRHTSVKHNVPTNCFGSPTPVPECSG